MKRFLGHSVVYKSDQVISVIKFRSAFKNDINHCNKQRLILFIFIVFYVLYDYIFVFFV